MRLFRLFRNLFSSIFILAIKKLIYPKRIHTLFFFVLWVLLLALFFSSLCQLASVIWFIPSKWPTNDRTVWDWTRWVPPVHQSSSSDVISRLWSLYLAKHVLPPKDVTVLVFTSLSPFPNGSHLRDPRFYVERKREKDLLTATLHGFVSRVIWIYPSWQRNSLSDFHVTNQMKVGITSIDLSDKIGAQPLFPDYMDYSEVSNPSIIDTICICPLSGGSCALPLLYSAEITISPEACTKNATVVYEQVIDLLAESLLLKLSFRNDKEDSVRASKGIYPGSLQGPSLSSTTQSPWFPVSRIPYKSLPSVMLIDSSYFGSVSIENSHPVKLDSEENLPSLDRSDLSRKFTSMIQSLFYALRSSFGRPSDWDALLELTVRYVDFAILQAPLSVSSRREPFSSAYGYPCQQAQLERARFTMEQRASQAFWYSLFSVFDGNRSAICSRAEPLVNEIALAVSSSATVSRIVTQILHWLCQLDEPKLHYLVSKRPCFVSESDRSSSSPPLLGLCTRLSTSTAAPVHRIRSSESALVFSRLYTIIENLPIPRFIVMINDSATFSSRGTSDVTFFNELCDMFRQLY
ncbi:uncharacterized protein DEA37_0000822 [Paragonimus westermani]|uniref:Uncharacterized protein n=1 Tax=Paragonimus westermani TaxID=34504 RepID=A0A5J4NRD8_9TREM|nr:uncharacterized protein DEA37_0000822 [Paragonimus westermani]